MTQERKRIEFREKRKGEMYKWFLIQKYSGFGNDKMMWERKRFKFIFCVLYLDEGKGRERRGEKNREKMRGERYKWFLI